MAVIKISELPEATTMEDSDVLAMVKGVATQKITRENLFKGIAVETENIVYVAKNGNDSNDGTQGNPFLTIGAANDYAITLLNPIVDWEEAVVIKAAPGKYIEHFTDSHRRIYIISNTFDLENWRHDVIIENTGVDEDHYIFDLDIGCNLIGITVQVTTGDILGVLPNKMLCSMCQFRGGYFIENTKDTDSLTAYFNYCIFANGGFRFEGVNDRKEFIAFRHCDIFAGTDTIFSSTGTNTRAIKLENTKVGNPLTVSGDWSIQMNVSELYADGSLIFGTNGYIDFYNNIIVNGIHFVSDTVESKRFVNNYFRSITPGQTDITVEAGITISIVDYSGNKQENGLPANFQIAGGDRNVGAFAENLYCSLQCAISSIPAGESGIIEIYENQSDLAELILNAGSSVTIKCSKKYDLSFTGNVVTLGANQSLNFHEVAFLDGGKLEINGDSAILAFEGCLTIQGYIVSTSGVGSMVLSYFSSLVSVTGHPVLQADNVDTLHVSGYSRWKGAAGQPAVIFNVLTENKLKGKFTSFLHGDFGGNAPLVYIGAGKVEFSIYNSAFNASVAAASFTNLIGSPNNSISPEINF